MAILEICFAVFDIRNNVFMQTIVHVLNIRDNITVEHVFFLRTSIFAPSADQEK
jgi:hypothetical protein